MRHDGTRCAIGRGVCRNTTNGIDELANISGPPKFFRIGVDDTGVYHNSNGHGLEPEPDTKKDGECTKTV